MVSKSVLDHDGLKALIFTQRITVKTVKTMVSTTSFVSVNIFLIRLIIVNA